MLDAAQKALEFTKDKERQDLDRDENLALAIVRLIDIIGDAAVKVTHVGQQLGEVLTKEAQTDQEALWK